MKLVFALVSTLAGAQAQAVECVARSQANLGGDEFATISTQDAQAVSGTLRFAPASFFLADGYGVKVFTAPLFGGAGVYLGGVDDLPQAEARHLHKAAGGYYVNVDELKLPGAVRSFACVPVGQPFPASNSFADGLAYFNDRAFGLTGYRGNHPNSTSVTVTFDNGKKTVTATSSYGLGNDWSSRALDLDSGDILHTDSPHSTGANTEKLFKKGDSDYAGELYSLKSAVEEVAKNDQGERRPDKYVPIANLELLPLVKKLHNL